MFKTRWDDPKVIRVPENFIPYYLSQGWHVLARDTEHPLWLDVDHVFDPCMALGNRPRPGKPPEDQPQGDGA